MPKIDIEASLTVIAGATEGPWEMRRGGNFTDFGAVGFIDYCEEHSHSSTPLNLGSTNWRFPFEEGNDVVPEANGAFIVAARDPITGWEPALLELKEARAELQYVDGELFNLRQDRQIAAAVLGPIGKLVGYGASDLGWIGFADAIRKIVEDLRAELKRRDEPVTCSLGTGTKHYSWTYCPQPCGRTIYEGDAFCPGCGRKLEWL